MSQDKTHILDLTLAQLEDICVDRFKEPRYRAKQIFEWIYHRFVSDFSRMSNLPKSFREKLGNTFFVDSAQEVVKRESRDGTIKLYLVFHNACDAESVLIPSKKGFTACLSTQSGCPVRCAFCATGQGEYKGNLSAGQIVEQILHLNRVLRGKRITRIVFMGMGEPLLNYNNMIKAIRIINAKWGFNIGARKITVSTVGIPNKIRELANEDMQINLAISLHHPDQRGREMLIPLAKKYTLDDIITSAGEYFKKTKREITIEYLLIKDVNCSLRDADKLAYIAHELKANVNLIVYNFVEGLGFDRPSKQAVRYFQERLRRCGVVVHIRASKGADIEAACGQLRSRIGKKGY